MYKLLGATVLALAASAAAGADGEVKKIDKAQAKVTIKHAGIANLDMPPMTMVFTARDTQALDALAIGDRVRFSADKLNGQYTVTAIEKAPG